MGMEKFGGGGRVGVPSNTNTTNTNTRNRNIKTSRLTFAGLLNAIDGIAAQTGRLLFMTTNHKDRLDSALIRPGRIDYQLKFSMASRDQARRLFLNFYRSLLLTANGVSKEELSLI
jgi:ATP-dependent 26S proteasome regulatory subunit